MLAVFLFYLLKNVKKHSVKYFRENLSMDTISAISNIVCLCFNILQDNNINPNFPIKAVAVTHVSAYLIWNG